MTRHERYNEELRRQIMRECPHQDELADYHAGRMAQGRPTAVGWVVLGVIVTVVVATLYWLAN